MVLKLVDILTDEFCDGIWQDKIVDNDFTVSVVSMAGGFALNEKEQEHKLEHGMQLNCGYYWNRQPQQHGKFNGKN